MSITAQRAYQRYFGGNEWTGESSSPVTDYFVGTEDDEYRNAVEVNPRVAAALLELDVAPFLTAEHMRVHEALAAHKHNFVTISAELHKQLAAIDVFEQAANIKRWSAGLTWWASASNPYYLCEAKKAARPVSFKAAKSAQAVADIEPRSLEETFANLTDEWKGATEFSSSMTDIVMHPAYQRIIGLGPKVIPLVLRDLEVNGGHWFAALGALTGANPVDDEDAGRHRRMREAWLNWGREQELI
jgi:hypothetical protein